MAMKKIADGEGKIEVLRGAEAQVVQEHRERVGKAVSEFSDDERTALESDLANTRDSEKTPE